EAMPVPEDLDWDLWIGPAPYRPYNEVYLPGPKWYRWWDFGNGTMSDLGSHWIDLPFWALKLDAPLTVEASGPPPHPEIAPASMSAKYTYNSRGELPPLTLTWHQGSSKPEIWKEKGIPQWGNGVLFIGKTGMLLSDYSKHVLLPEKEFANVVRPPQTIPPSIGHQEEWINACKTGSPTTCHFGYSGPLTEANHLGNVAFRAGKKIEWDSITLQIPNAREVEKYLQQQYREGWSLG
ncbi:MAG TPA: gfo/Idh/MocA family oxidoreductase, partial [Terriglobia bacterium]|nr:gfo/Idh/MocA family oxidoreductase [Terriglobia bacterium]